MRFTAQQGANREAVTGAYKARGPGGEAVEDPQESGGNALVGRAAAAFERRGESAAIAQSVREQRQRQHRRGAMLPTLIEAQEP